MDDVAAILKSVVAEKQRRGNKYVVEEGGGMKAGRDQVTQRLQGEDNGWMEEREFSSNRSNRDDGCRSSRGGSRGGIEEGKRFEVGRRAFCWASLEVGRR